MAAAVKALNAKIRSNKYTDYLCSTHFWGPASNFGIPIAAVMDTQKDPEIISGAMTLALSGYSAVFMRYAFAVTPKNYLLFGCHFINFGSQLTQGYRYVNYHHLGGKEAKVKMQQLAGDVKSEFANVKGQAQEYVEQAKGELMKAEKKVEGEVRKVMGK